MNCKNGKEFSGQDDDPVVAVLKTGYLAPPSGMEIQLKGQFPSPLCWLLHHHSHLLKLHTSISSPPTKDRLTSLPSNYPLNLASATIFSMVQV